MIALIDADIVCFRCAAACELEPEEMALIRTHDMMTDILATTGADEYIPYLTGSTSKYPITDKINFRNLINPEYKANRTQVAPLHIDACRRFLIDHFNAVVCEGYEADDALGVEQDKIGDEHGNFNTVICSIDKDLLMIPGFHYNFVKKEFSEVGYLQGIKHFYKQMLIGDTSDNIIGVKGIGKVKAGNIIDPLETEEEMFNAVYDLYDDAERFDMNADCLWIWRKYGERWSNREWTNATEKGTV